jgi:hypothetical protein
LGTEPVNRGKRARVRLRTLIRWLWLFETSRVTRGEFLLRAIPNDPSYLKETMGNWAVAPYAFQPHKKRDADGMSFFREDFVTPREVSQRNGFPAGVRVVRIAVKQLLSLGLVVEPSPDPSQPAGHVIVPGLKFDAARTKEEKKRIAEISQLLAKAASANIAYVPPRMDWPRRV